MDSGSGDREPYLQPGFYINSDHPEVIRFSERVAGSPDSTANPPDARCKASPPKDARGKAVALYYAIRDEFRYDPYRIDLNPDAMKASALLERGYGFCIAKAVLLAASARHQGIPSRLGFADVMNHLNTARLRKSMGTDLFVYHGFAELLVDGKWVKATPAFNKSLCERFGVPALEFDGVSDAVFQPYDSRGNQYMEYVRDHGHFTDLPLDILREAFEEAYPQLMSGGVCYLTGRFEDDAVLERARRRSAG